MYFEPNRLTNDLHVGHFDSENRLHGEGVHRSLNGDQYIGQFKADQMHEIGRYTYKNGTEYYGEWKGNNPDGKGLLYQKHETYQGKWKDSKKHGLGVREDFITDQIHKEVWDNGQKIDETRIF